MQERDGNDTVLREYTWGLNLGGGIGGLLNLKQGGQDYSYLYDGKGNVAAVLDASQSVVAAYRYAPFGELLAKTGSLTQPFGFSTKRYDAQTGLIHYQFRNYAPAIERWTTRDPLGEADGMNLYAFVGNNPVNWGDPWGLELLTNNSEYVAYYKDGVPGGTAAIPIQPGETIDVNFDGIAQPCLRPGEVQKVVDGVDATIHQDVTMTLTINRNVTGRLEKEKIKWGQWVHRKPKKEEWNKRRNEKDYHDWDDTFKKSQEEYCKK